MPTSRTPSDAASSTRNVTMQDIANLVGVSKAAVSQALAGQGRISSEKRRLILETAQKLGFEPDPHARRLSTGGFEKLIGLFSLDLDLGTETLKLSYIQQLLMERGFDVSLHAFGFLQFKELMGAETLLRQVCRLKPRAIVCNTRDLHASTLEMLRPYQHNGGIVICYDHPVDFDCDQVIFDRVHNAALATRHLADAGHRRIGMHPGHLHPRDQRFSSPRFAGFKAALKAEKITLQKEAIFYSERSYEEAGLDIAAQFLALPQSKRPTALYIVNDRAAAAFVNSVMRAGLRVPADISIISEDDLPSAASCIVPLTAVSQPVRTIAETVVELLEARLQNQQIPSHVEVIKGHLASRESVAQISR